MTEIIPGLQGDLPANSKKGVPFVAGKYDPLLLIAYLTRYLFLLCDPVVMLITFVAVNKFVSDTFPI